MGSARDLLLEQVIDHVAENGLADASLRELAAAVGTSHRMLHYHFGGRDGLVAAIVDAMESRQRELLAAIALEAATPVDAIRAQWAVLSDPALAPFVRLFFEVVALAMAHRPGTEGFLDRLTEPWIEAGMDASAQFGVPADPADIRLGVAVSRGLLLDAVASGDPRAATTAMERFVSMWERSA